MPGTGGWPWTRRPRAGLGATEAAALSDELVRSGAAVRVGRWLVDRDTVAAIRTAAADQVQAHHERAPLERAWTLAALASELRVDADRLRAALADDGALVVERGYVRDATRRSRPADSAEARALARRARRGAVLAARAGVGRRRAVVACARSRAKAPSSTSTGSCSRPARSTRPAGGYEPPSGTAGR